MGTMNATIRSIISHGPEGLPVDIECHLSNSLPNIVIVGFANKTVDESKERIRGAFTNAFALFPQFDLRPHKTVLLRGGVLMAWAPARVIDPVASLQ